MIFLSEQQTWTVGDIVRRMREEQGIGLEQLARGLCSAATLSRIEAGGREMDLLLAARIFQRLGYSIDKYEFYAGAEELEQWDQRQNMQRLSLAGETESLVRELDRYRKKWAKQIEQNPIQRQFTDYIQGILLLDEKRFSEAAKLLEESVSYTVPDWEKEAGQAVIGGMEIEILDRLGDAYEQMGASAAGSRVRELLTRNISTSGQRMKTYLRPYAGILCKYADQLLEEKGAGRTLRSVDEILELMSEEKTIYRWPELLELRARCLEQLYREGTEEKETVLGAWRKAYYIFRLFEKWEKAEEIHSYLEEEYQWECII